ncbi:MAG: OsmC family protein [Sphingobacteriia bacterium]|nr:OsmC family protein [Sphingobacteriia bacterium]
MVNVTRLKQYTVIAKSRNHELTIDVDNSLNGLDLGMDPHELVKAALAACTSITLQMYADRKQWNLESADVEIDIEDEKGNEVKFSRIINLKGNLNEEQRQKLLEIANKCPVHKLLEKPSIITSYLKD